MHINIRQGTELESHEKLYMPKTSPSCRKECIWSQRKVIEHGLKWFPGKTTVNSIKGAMISTDMFSYFFHWFKWTHLWFINLELLISLEIYIFDSSFGHSWWTCQRWMNGFLHNPLSPPDPHLAFIRIPVLIYLQYKSTAGVRKLLTHRMLLCPSCCLSPLPVTQTFPLTARAQFLMCVPGFLNSGNFVSPCSSHILSHHQFYTCCPLLVCFPFWYCCFYKVVFSFCGEHWQPVEKVISNYLFTQNYVYYFFFRFLLNCNFFISMSVNCLPGYVSMSTHITEPL